MPQVRSWPPEPGRCTDSPAWRTAPSAWQRPQPAAAASGTSLATLPTPAQHRYSTTVTWLLTAFFFFFFSHGAYTWVTCFCIVVHFCSHFCACKGTPMCTFYLCEHTCMGAYVCACMHAWLFEFAWVCVCRYMCVCAGRESLFGMLRLFCTQNVHVLWPIKTELTISHHQNNKVKEVGTPPVQSNLCASLIAVSTAVWSKVTKTVSEK